MDTQYYLLTHSCIPLTYTKIEEEEGGEEGEQEEGEQEEGEQEEEEEERERKRMRIRKTQRDRQNNRLR